MSNTIITPTTFNWDALFAGNADIVTQRMTIKSTQGVLARGTALGQSYLTAGSAVAGTHTGTEAVTAISVKAFASPGAYTLQCTAVNAGVGTWAVFDPKGARLADATAGVAYSDQIGFTIGAGSAVNDTYTITVSDARTGLIVTDIAAYENAGLATLTTATVQANAVAGQYVLVCTVVAGAASTFSVTGPGGALANATQGTAYSTQIGFTIGGGAPALGDGFIVTVGQGVVENVVCLNTNTDGSQKVYAILADDQVDTTNGDIIAAVYLTGEFAAQNVIFGAGDSYVNHINDKPGLYFVPIHP